MMVHRKLKTGEWRLFLLSDCLKYYPDVANYTKTLRQTKEGVLSITGVDSLELDNFISDEESIKIKSQIRKEWKFTEKVIDNGRGRKTTCEYCQSQQIRYRYVCYNHKTNTTLHLGSVCVGNVIFGEERMKDTEFANKLVEDLEGLKRKATSHSGREQVRKEQKEDIRKCMTFLKKYSPHKAQSDFVQSLKEQWEKGYSLSDKQMSALKTICTRVKQDILKKTKEESR